jgi:hypothetical protein
MVYSLEWSKGAVTAMILMATCLAVLLVFAWLTHIGTRWTRVAQR